MKAGPGGGPAGPLPVWVLSNGLAEDMVGARLAVELVDRGRHLVSVTGVPLLATPAGVEDPYYRASRAGVRVLDASRLNLPSGGFGRLRFSAARQDWQAGWWPGTRGWLATLAADVRACRRSGHEVAGAFVCVGDSYLLFLAAWARRKARRAAGGGSGEVFPIYFVPTAKSELLRGHFLAEYALMKRVARSVFPRDAATAAALKRHGVPAAYLGNPLLDVGGAAEAAEARARREPAENGQAVITIGLLPGSRADWRENLDKLRLVEEALAKRRPEVAWRFLVSAPLARPEPARDTDVPPEGERESFVPFSELLARADLVVGMAGTAHEQAAALGLPVVAFPGGRIQYTAAFARAQKRLLGPALALLPPDPEAVAGHVLAILDDPERRRQMAAAGRERMGSPGGVAAIARAVLADLIPIAGLIPASGPTPTAEGASHR